MGYLKTLKMYVSGKPKKLDAPTDLYAHKVTLLEGGELDLETRRGKPTLFVNTASKCGFTPQFTGLQELYDKYGEQGFAIVGTPSGDFADQEHDDADAIGEVCQRNYGVKFPITEKMSVRADPAPLWADLTRQPGAKAPAWNFSKYLVDGDGKLVAYWPTKTKPEDKDIAEKVEQLLR